MNRVNKNKVAKNFGASAISYDHTTPIQQEMAESLLASINEFFISRPFPERILEIGCGTGRLTSYLRRSFPHSEIVAVDISRHMLAATAQRFPEVTLIEADGEVFLKSADKQYDLIVSNATFQWFDDAIAALRNAQSMRSANGYLAISSFGQQTFSELRHSFVAAYKELLRQPRSHLVEMINVNELRHQLPDALIEDHVIRLEFDRVIDFLRSLQKAGVVNAHHSIQPLKRDVLSKMVTNYQQNFSNQDGDKIFASYHVFKVLMS